MKNFLSVAITQNLFKAAIKYLNVVIPARPESF